MFWEASEPMHCSLPETRPERMHVPEQIPSPLHGMDQVPVAMGLAVRVQPVLQELFLRTVLQAEQVVHVLLSKQTHREESPLSMVTTSCGCAEWLWF